jgi:hypothetical protein
MRPDSTQRASRRPSICGRPGTSRRAPASTEGKRDARVSMSKDERTRAAESRTSATNLAARDHRAVVLPRWSQRRRRPHREARTSHGKSYGRTIPLVRSGVPVVLSALIVAIVIVGCGGSSKTSTRSTARATGICKTSELGGSGGVPSPGAGSAGVTFRLRNLSRAPCILEGYPRLTMRGATGRRLPTTTVHAGGTPVLVTLIPSHSAFVTAGWPLPSSTCEGPRAAAVDVALPHVSGSVVVAVGSGNQPFSPCRGKIGVGPFEPR